MDKEWVLSFREKLDQHHRWPTLYVFKFIVPKIKIEELKALFPQFEVTEKTSAKGNYVSITISVDMPSSEAVIEVYRLAATVEGVIAL